MDENRKSRLESVEYDTLRIALVLLWDDAGLSGHPMHVSENIAENLLYWMVTRPDAKLRNPMSKFRARAENGDFEPVGYDEDPDTLPPNREPMTDEEFQEAKAKIIEIAKPWAYMPDAGLFELWQHAWQTVRERLWESERAALREDAEK